MVSSEDKLDLKKNSNINRFFRGSPGDGQHVLIMLTLIQRKAKNIGTFSFHRQSSNFNILEIFKDGITVMFAILMGTYVNILLKTHQSVQIYLNDSSMHSNTEDVKKLASRSSVLEDDFVAYLYNTWMFQRYFFRECILTEITLICFKRQIKRNYVEGESPPQKNQTETHKNMEQKILDIHSAEKVYEGINIQSYDRSNTSVSVTKNDEKNSNSTTKYSALVVDYSAINIPNDLLTECMNSNSTTQICESIVDDSDTDITNGIPGILTLYIVRENSKSTTKYSELSEDHSAIDITNGRLRIFAEWMNSNSTTQFCVSLIYDSALNITNGHSSILIECMLQKTRRYNASSLPQYHSIVSHVVSSVTNKNKPIKNSDCFDNNDRQTERYIDVVEYKKLSSTTASKRSSNWVISKYRMKLPGAYSEVLHHGPSVSWPSPDLRHKCRYIQESDVMNNVQRRLNSFILGENPRNTTWPDDAYVRPGTLAAAGLSYSGIGLNIYCDTCAFETNTSNWSQNNEDYALYIHMRTKVKCEFLQGILGPNYMVR